MIGLLKGRFLARKHQQENENHQNQQDQQSQSSMTTSKPKPRPRQTSLSEALVAAAATTERVQTRLAEISELQRAEGNNDETNTNGNSNAKANADANANADLNWSDNDDDNDNDSDDNSLLDFSNRSLSSSEEEESNSDSGSQHQHQRQEQEPTWKTNNGTQQQRQPQQSSTISLSSRDDSSNNSLDELSQLAPPHRATMIRADLLELSNISSAYTRSPSPDDSTTSSSDDIYYNHQQQQHQHNAHWQQQRLLPANRASAPFDSSNHSNNSNMPPLSAYPYEDRPANLEKDGMTNPVSLSPSQRRRVVLFSPLQNQPKQHPHYHDYDDYNDSSHGDLSLADQADYDEVLQRALLPDQPTQTRHTVSPGPMTARPVAVRVPWKSPWTWHSDPQTTSTSADADADVTTAKSTMADKQQHTVDTVMKKVAYVGLASSFAVAIWVGTATGTTTCTTQTGMTCWWTALATAATFVWSLYVLYVQYQVAKIPHLYREQVALQQTLQQWKCVNTHERSRHMAAQAGIQRWKLRAGVPAGEYEQNGTTATAATVIPSTTTTLSSPFSPTTVTPSSPSSPTIISTTSIRRRHTVATELLAAKRKIRHHQRSQIAKAVVEVLIHKKNAKGPAWEKDGCVWNMRSIRLLEVRILKIKGVRLDNVRLMAWWESQRQQELSSSAAVVTYLIRNALLEKNGFFVFESSPATARRNTLFTSTSASISTIAPKPNRSRRRSSTSSTSSYR